MVKAHDLRLILITPPPVDENMQEELTVPGTTERVKRTAERTKTYADAARDVGQELGVQVLDIWSAFMAEVGWKPGQQLAGSMQPGKVPVFHELLHDGELVDQL